MKALVLYHANCADGFGAAFAAWLKLGDEAEYVPIKYGDMPPVGWEGREIYILDFSFPKEVMLLLIEGSTKLVWLDHHKTAFEMWCGEYERGVEFYGVPLCGGQIELNDNKSGAMLAWNHFHPETEIPRLIQHIDDYDRWQFKILGTKEFNKALWSYAPWNFIEWNTEFMDSANSMDTRDDTLQRMYSEGAAILRAHGQNVQSVAKGACPCILLPSFDGTTLGERRNAPQGLMVNGPYHLASDVGHELAVQSGTFGMTWSMLPSGEIVCSLRSNGDYDVSALAKQFGGGGHLNAAGFKTSIGMIENFRTLVPPT